MQAAKKAPKGADGFFKEGGAKEELSATRKADQKAVDTVVCHLSPQTVLSSLPPNRLVISPPNRSCRYALRHAYCSICTAC